MKFFNRYDGEVPPRPWRVVTEKCFTSDDVECWGIVDANNNPIVVTDCGHYPPNIKTAELIVELVNEQDRQNGSSGAEVRDVPTCGQASPGAT